MRLLVCAGRHFHDARLVEAELARLHACYTITAVIHGGHATLGPRIEAWARSNLVHVIRYPATWQHLGKKAEIVRNDFMLEDGRADMLLALPGGRHTQDLVARAAARGVRVLRVESDAEDANTMLDGDNEPGRRRASRCESRVPVH